MKTRTVQELAATALLVACVAVAGCVSVNVGRNRTTTPGGADTPELRLEVRQDATVVPGQAGRVGRWAFDGDDLEDADALLLNITAGSDNAARTYAFTIASDRLEIGPATDDDSHPLILCGDGGTILLRSDFESDGYSGEAVLTLDATYAERMVRLLEPPPDGPFDWLRLVAADVKADTVQSFADAGYTVSVGDACRAATRGLSPPYARRLRDAGYDFSFDDLMNLKFRGVTADYAVAVREAGYDLTAGDFTNLRFRGVPADYMADLKAAGYDLSPSELINLRFRGVPADYATDLREGGYELSPSELINLRFRGVPADYAVKLRKAGYDLSPSELINLRFRGVPADYAAGMREAGYDFTPEELIHLRFRGVPVDYAAALQSPGLAPLTADELIELRFKGIDAETLRRIRRPAPEAEEVLAE